MGTFGTVLSVLGLGSRASAAPPRIEPSPAMPPPAPAFPSACVYPPVDPGIAVTTEDEILCAHEPLIGRIKLCYGTDRATFEQDLLVPIRNYAAFVNLLPATPDNYFAGPGGLFRLGLEVAFIALQGTDGHIVSGRSTISERRRLEPRWRQATFIAGLCAELHRTLNQLIVTDDKGNEWPAYLMPLSDWLCQRQAARMFVRWIPHTQESRALSLFALQQVVPRDILQHLATANSIVVPHLLASLSGMPLYREHNVLDALVRRAAALVIDRDLISAAHRYGRPILGAHLERYLIDAMRRLLGSHPAWGVNQERSRVWLSNEGLFVIWPNAAADIRKLLQEDELPGIPKAPETIAELLVAAGALEPTPDGGPLWTIAPPPGRQPFEAVRLRAPDILLAGLPERPPPLEQALLAPAQSAKPEAIARATRADGTTHTPVPAASTPPPAATPASDDTGAEPPREGDGPQQQLPLRDAAEEPDTAPAHAPPAPPSQPRFSLKAPLRLSPAVRGALTEIVESLNGDAKASSACTVSTGIFIPLAEFERRKVDPTLALRGLAECEMVPRTSSRHARTVQHDFADRHALGVVLLPSFVEGLDPADFAPAP